MKRKIELKKRKEKTNNKIKQHPINLLKIHRVQNIYKSKFRPTQSKKNYTIPAEFKKNADRIDKIKLKKKMTRKIRLSISSIKRFPIKRFI